MTVEEFNKHIEHIRQESLDTLVRKNTGYSSGSNDPVHNFTVGGMMIRGTAIQAAWSYMTKHLVALCDKVMNNDFSNIPDFEEKCQDIINYVAIIYAMGIDENIHSFKHGSSPDVPPRCHD